MISENTTIKELRESESIIDKHQSWKHSNVRNLCRKWNKNLIKICQNCEYNVHIEFCHIRPISDFPDTATLGEINNYKNILILCRNCHWEFDNGLITLEEILSNK